MALIGEGDAPKTSTLPVGDAAVECELLPAPQDDPDTARLQEHGLLDLLALPTQPLVERPSALDVAHTQSDQADPLLHCRTVLRRAPDAVTATAQNRPR